MSLPPSSPSPLSSHTPSLPSRAATLLIALGTLLTILGAGISITRRHAVEQANRSVALAVESDVVSSLAVGARITEREAMTRLKTAGFRSLVVSEESLGEMISGGRAEIFPWPISNASSGTLALRLIDLTLIDRVRRGLDTRFGRLVPPDVLGRRDVVLLPRADIGLIRGASIGLSPEIVAEAKRQGFTLIARAGNPGGADTELVKATLAGLARQGATVFLPSGDQVIGRRDGTEAAIATLRETGMLYASPEFAKLGGDVEMLKALPDRSVRLHAAQSAELDKLSLAGAVERYTKAASERNMRVLLLRPIGGGGPDPLGAFADFGRAVVTGMARDGLTPGEAQPYRDPAPPSWTRILIGVGIALVVGGTARLLDLGRGLLVLAALAGVGAVLATLRPGTAELSALLATLAFPVAGVLVAFEHRMRTPLALLVAVVVSLAGGLAVAGLLNGLPYLVRAETFSGVKLAVFLPILVIGAVAFSRLADLRSGLKNPITWGSAGIGVLVLFALLVLVVRSGNDAPAGVSGGELAFRGLLEDILPVRPRTKTFLIGLPALLLGFALLSRTGYRPSPKQAPVAALLVMLGGIALTDIVNTFCHLHTPIVVSLLRVVIGVGFGAVIGTVLWLFARATPPFRRATD